MLSRPERDPAGAFLRESIAQRRLGENAACPCGEARSRALSKKYQICAECLRKKKGHKEMDKHHPASEANDSCTVEIPVNDHRAFLSVAQHEWPKETLENPDKSPLRRAAACIRGFIDMLYYMLEKFLFWTAEMFEVLDDFLIETLGSKWWVDTPLARFTKEAQIRG